MACHPLSRSPGAETHSWPIPPRLEMHVAIAAISVPAGSMLKIADHGKCHAGISRQVLSQTEGCRHQALVPWSDSFQLCMLRPEAINTRLQVFDAMDIEIKMDVTMCSEIGEQTLPCGGEASRKFRGGDRVAPSRSVQSRTPWTNDVTDTVYCGVTRLLIA